MSYKNLKTIPIYKKALKLCKMSRAISLYVSSDKGLLKLYQSECHRDIIADSIITDSALIQQKIAQAEYSKSHSVRINSAIFINVMTRNILSYCTGLERDGVKEKEYVNLLRSEIKSFRKTFKKWRSSLR